MGEMDEMVDEMVIEDDEMVEIEVIEVNDEI